MKKFLKVMKAISDPNRVKIIKLLLQKVMCVCELQAALEISQPSVSKHLKILQEAGLVDYQKDGLWANYFLSDGLHSPYAASLLGNIKHWLNDASQVADLVKKTPFLNRKEICNSSFAPSISLKANKCSRPEKFLKVKSIDTMVKF